MYCLSVSYRKTPVSIRQRFSFSIEEQKRFLAELTEQKLITGGVIVSTCNRSELYVTGEKKIMESLGAAVASFKQIEERQIKKYCLVYGGKSAIRHLYKVACGLDSMVLGEDEILRQVKEAYLDAAKQGYTNGELNMIFQGALNCAKLAKSKTKLSTTPVSIGTLTANEIEKYLKEKRGEDYRNGLVLVIGAAGKIGSIVTKDLAAKGISVVGTSRRHHSDSPEASSEPNVSEEALERLCQVSGAKLPPGMKGIEFVSFHDRYTYAAKADAVVSATSSPHYTLTEEEYTQKAKKTGAQLLIDMAVPYDIDKEIGKLEGKTLYDIDYFTTLSNENSNIKLGERKKADQILEDCVEETLKKLYVRDCKGKLEEKYKEEWFRKMLYYLKETLDSEQLKSVLERIYTTERGEC